MTRWTVASAALFLVAFAYYLHGMAPTVTVGDSGEFITAAYTLGVPHPSGFPTYNLAGHLFSVVIPWANPGFRLNLFSAVLGAGAVTLLLWTARAAGAGLPAAAAGALLFASSPALAASSQGSEVFALHAALTAATLVAALRKQFWLAALFVTAGIGNHQTIVLLMPGLLAGLLGEEPGLLRQRAWWIGLTVAVVSGLALYATLLIRAQKHPVLNVGDGETVERLWRIFRRADFGSLTLALGETPARTFSNTLAQLRRYGIGLERQVGWVGLIVGVLGGGALLTRRRMAASMIGFGFLLFGPFFFWLGNLPFDAQSWDLLERFHVVPTLLWAIFFAAGVELLGSRIRWGGWTAAVLAMALIAPKARAITSRSDLLAYGYGRNLLHSLPPRALFLIDGGDDTFYATAYMTQVERRRPDIEFHDRGGVVFPGLYGPDFRALTRDEKEQRRAVIEPALANGTRPLSISTMNEQLLKSPYFAAKGLLYYADAAQLRPSSEQVWQLYDLRGLAPWLHSSNEPLGPYRRRALAPYYAFQRGVEAEVQGDERGALNFVRSARAQGPDVLWLLPNSANVFHRWAYAAYQAGRREAALKFYSALIGWNPSDALARANRGAVLERAGRMKDALNDYEAAVRADPGSAPARFNLAAMYWRQARWQQAEQELRRVLEIDPNYPRAREFYLAAKAHAAD